MHRKLYEKKHNKQIESEMGRKEKETNPADVAVVAKRTYTRRNTINNDNVGLIKSNNMTSTTEQFNNAVSK